MDLSDAPDDAVFRDEVRRWLAGALPTLPWPEPAELVDKLPFWRQWQQMVFEAGYAGPSWPAEYGGGGMAARRKAILTEEMDRAGAPERLNTTGEDFAGPTIADFGTDAQKERFLPPILRGEAIWCQLFSEPEAGSDLASLRTRATRADDGWRIQGQKIWTSRAHIAAYAILLARTGGGPRHKGITYFLLPMNSPGITVRPLRHMLGEAEFNEVFLDNVFVPDELVVGEVDGGWKVAMATLGYERVAIATGRVNTRRAVENIISDVAGSTAADGRPLGADPLVRQKIADLYGRSLVHYVIGQRVLSLAAADGPPGPVTSIGKLYFCPLVEDLADFRLSLDPLGGQFDIDDDVVDTARWMRLAYQARGTAIAGGSTYIQRSIIAERMLGMPRELIVTEYTWTPTSDYVENANVTRLGRSNGIATIEQLRARSVADIAWYWDAVVRDLQIGFRTPYTRVVDLSAGIEHPDWFVDGTLNIVDACITRWAADAETAARPAVVHEAEDGAVRTLSFAELDDRIRRASEGLRRLGVGKGDAVALFLPMIPEAIVSVYALARLGAVLVPLFSGFAPGAVAARLQDAEAVAVIVADGTVRRRHTVAMKPLLDAALKDCPSVVHVVVVTNIGGDEVIAPREISWDVLLDNDGDPGEAEPMAATDTLLLAYTSGTTGRPKGAVHTHAGFLVKTASEVAYSFDLSAGGVFCWITDMGWIMGPLSIVGTHANGGTLLVYEGSPDVPDLDRLWDLVQRHGVSMLGVSPTLIRTLRTYEQADRSAYDLSCVHTIGSTGEPWDPASYAWLAQEVFGSRVPIINFSGGTEVGGSFLAPYPVETIRSCSLGGPSLGMDVDVVDDAGTPVRGEIGELICRQPWPAMTRGVWKDPDRSFEAYWSTFPGVWRHGDYALVDGDGQWFILGRSDDVMNVAGKRLAPAEIESIMATHHAVAEVAAVGIPDATKGEAVWAFWVPRPDAAQDVSDELRDMIARELGKPFAPKVVVRVSQLPKTRSAKILRRAVRAAVLGTDPGDLSGAENPGAVDLIRSAVRERT